MITKSNFRDYVTKELCTISHKDLNDRLDRVDKRMDKQDMLLFSILGTVLTTLMAVVIKGYLGV